MKTFDELVEKEISYKMSEIEVPRNELLRLLSYRGKAKVPPRINKLLYEYSEEGYKTVKLQGKSVMYAVESEAGKWKIRGMELRGRTVERALKGAEYAILGLTTAGVGLDEKIGAYFKENNSLGAVILDAFGSAIIEEFTGYFHAYLCKLLLQYNLHVSPRVSPGYGDFKVEEQRKFLELLPFEKLKVSLTNSFLMVPQKSITFLAGISEEKRDEGGTSPCKQCNLKTCPYRRE